MHHQKEIKYLEDVMFAMEQHYSEIDIEAKEDYQSTRDDIKKRVLLFLFLHVYILILDITIKRISNS